MVVRARIGVYCRAYLAHDIEVLDLVEVVEVALAVVRAQAEYMAWVVAQLLVFQKTIRHVESEAIHAQL